jgi:hypothetical protein
MPLFLQERRVSYLMNADLDPETFFFFFFPVAFCNQVDVGFLHSRGPLETQYARY